MHVEIKDAMFNYVTYDKSRRQPMIYFHVYIFRTKVSHQFFTQIEKGSVVSPEPDIVSSYTYTLHCHLMTIAWTVFQARSHELNVSHGIFPRLVFYRLFLLLMLQLYKVARYNTIVVFYMRVLEELYAILD